MIVRPLPYYNDSSIYFEVIKDKPYAVYLDSCADSIESGRYDIISASPIKKIHSKNGVTNVTSAGKVTSYTTNPFEVLEEHINKNPSLPEGVPDLPFFGGAIGYFAYDLGRTLETIPNAIKDDLLLPDMEVGIYDWAIIVDHQQHKTHFVGEQISDYHKKLIAEITTQTKPITRAIKSEFTLTSPHKWCASREEYNESIKKIQQYIYKGDCYQVNFAQRLSAEFIGSDWQLYKTLRKHNPAPYSAYFKGEEISVLSCSPEQFVSLAGTKVTAKPIKGTIERNSCEYEDLNQADILKQCEKNRAENLMIVDLLRNDLGKVCKPGSIKVPKLFEIESYENIHHLVSTITGEIKTPNSAIDLLKQCFPGGSITGAPKIRAMEIIEELEKHRRGVYCGAIGYISSHGAMNTNIAIRTAVTKNNSIHYWAGGGIVADSEANSEYQEMLTKSSAFLSGIESS